MALGLGNIPLAQSLLSPKVAFNLGGKTEQDPCVKYDRLKKKKERAKMKNVLQCDISVFFAFSNFISFF